MEDKVEEEMDVYSKLFSPRGRLYQGHTAEEWFDVATKFFFMFMVSLGVNLVLLALLLYKVL